MRKKDFIDRVAEKAEMTRSAAARTVEAIFDAAEGAIVEAMRAGEHISLPGFGRFRTKTRSARTGRNPRTGQEIKIPERTVMHFSSSKSVTETLAGKKPARKSARKSAGAKAAGAKSTAKSAAKGAARKSASGAGAKSATAKSSGAKSASSKSAATKSAGSKSAATKTAATKSAGSKSASSKSAGKKSGGRSSR